MRSTFALAAITVALSMGCHKDEPHSTTRTTAATEPASPDNTKINQRDRVPTYTPLDQGNDAIDLKMTQQIRQLVMEDASLSIDAKNVKIITKNGFVILRGPVKTIDERDRIEAKALGVVSPDRLDNELELETR